MHLPRRLPTILLVASLVSGCGLLTGIGGRSASSLGWGLAGDIGLEDRCRDDRAPGDDPAACQSAAEEAMLLIATNLGDTYAGPGIEHARPQAEPELAPAVSVMFEREPPFDWRAVDGSRGQATAMAVDLEPHFKGSGQAYAVLDTDQGTVRRLVPARLAERLLNAVFVRTH
jgi:hypothetical protein